VQSAGSLANLNRVKVIGTEKPFTKMTEDGESWNIRFPVCEFCNGDSAETVELDA
jgi:hypothetical protein